MTRWTLAFADTYLTDLRELPVFDRARVQASVASSLEGEPDRPTRHRRPLKSGVGWCPEATWQLRVGEYRVLYRIQNSSVEILRVRFKGRRTTEAMGPR